MGVLSFSLTVPLTRVAVSEGMDPLFAGAGRAMVATVLAVAALALRRQPLPRGGQWASVAVVGAGIVIGFPLLTSFALMTVPANHGAIVIAVLPAVTAVAAVLRTRERPSLRFWLYAALGACVAVGFAVLHGGGVGGFALADVLLLGAVVLAAVGYAEGGLLARTLGSWQVVCWALVVTSPVMAALTASAVLTHGVPTADAAGWTSFAYLGAISMFLGFFAWYRGLGIGPMAQVSQIQLVQPLVSLAWAALLLGERITPLTAAGAGAVIACTALAVRTRSRPREDGRQQTAPPPCGDVPQHIISPY